MGEPWLHLIRCGRVVFKPVIPLDGDFAGGHIENYISEPATIVLVTKGDQGFKLFLQMRGVILDRLVLGVRISVGYRSISPLRSRENERRPYPVRLEAVW